ncbi:MAG: RNA-binding protein [Verrucomicrobiaceae bacterium]|nr:RNA-binding protein [Verrucomicrobiaceae bacterium]
MSKEPHEPHLSGKMNHRSIYQALILTWLLALANCSQDPAETGKSPAPQDPPKTARPLSPAPAAEGSITSSPLNAAGSDLSENKQQKLFSLLDPAKTGITFTNPISNAHPLSYLYASAMGCGGISVGDINDDGRPDLFFTGGPVPNRLYIQTDNLIFKDITQSAGVAGDHAWATGSSIVDIDNDGDRDIYVCNYDAANSLYLNQGNGKFIECAEKFGLDLVSAGHTPAFCDFDLDGHLDLYLMTNFFYDPEGQRSEAIVARGKDGKPMVLPKFRKFYGITGITRGDTPDSITVNHDSVGQSDHLMRNNGNGTFTALTRPGQLVGKGNSAIWWDPDSDGRPDLYVANDFKDTDFFLRNVPGGPMSNDIKSAFPHITWFSMGSDSADLNGDGLADIVITDMSGTNHFKQKVGMGAMSDNAEFLTTAFPRQYMRNTVFINTGTSRFREAAYMSGLANSDWTWTIRLSDFDNDGLVDVFITNGMAVNLNVADNTIASQKALPGETEWAKHVRAGTGPLKEQNLAFRNLGDLAFDNVSKPWGLDHVGMSYAATAADLDRDGDLELIVTNLEEPISIYRNDTKQSNRILVKLRGTQSNSDGIGATVRVHTDKGEQLRFLTLSRGYMASGESLVHFGLGNESTIKTLSVLWPSGHRQIFENLEANRQFTITEPAKAGPGLPTNVDLPKPMFQPMPVSLSQVSHREEAFDDFALQPLLPQKLSQLGPGMAWGDIDSDGDHDLYIAGAKGSIGQLLRNRGKGDFTLVNNSAWQEDGNHEDMGALFLDTDSDGDMDLYVVSGGVECNPGDPLLQDRIYINDGNGTFSKAPAGTLPEMHASGGTVSACDFDADGDLDLFVGGRVVPGKYPLSPKSYLLRNDKGIYKDVTNEIAPGLSEPGMVTGSIWSDADGDGKTDLLLTCDWGPIRYFHNTGGKLQEQTETTGLYDQWGWWNSIAASDVDHDGDIDYAVTNFGLNTKYHASIKKPTRLFYGDFGNQGKECVVEAEYENDTLYPVRGRSCSSHAMPFLFDKFKTYKGFAVASLTDIYSPKTLSKSQQFAASELRSGILINDGKANFTFQPLPRIAQIAPAFGVDFCDIDGDGNDDLYIAQNFHGPQPETGRMAGGVSQLLKGDGTGKFIPVRPDKSGLVVPGDATSLTRVDLDNDGWHEFVLGINNAKIMVFQNKNQSVNRSLIVHLVGKKGNPTGVGSRITVVLDDGSKKTAEVRAGSGYLSQNPPEAIFGIKAGRKISSVKVHWPNGTSSMVEGPVTRNPLQIRYPNLSPGN